MKPLQSEYRIALTFQFLVWQFCHSSISRFNKLCGDVMKSSQAPEIAHFPQESVEICALISHAMHSTEISSCEQLLKRSIIKQLYLAERSSEGSNAIKPSCFRIRCLHRYQDLNLDPIKRVCNPFPFYSE